MRLSLRLRIVLGLAAIAAFTLTGVALFSRYVAFQAIERVAVGEGRRSDPESFRQPLLVHWNRARSWAGVLPLLRELAGNSSKLLLVSSDGRTLAAWPPHLASPPGDLGGAPGVAVPGATLYVLSSQASTESPSGPLGRSLDRLLLLAALLAFAFALIVALAISQYILRPMRDLTDVANEIAQGRFDRQIPRPGHDEIGRLFAAFHTIAQRLAHTELLRRNMAGDISHELRTPLTRMQCQVEAIQDGLAPAIPEALRHIHEQIRILERLTDDLQDLSLCDAGQLKVNPAPLRLDELLSALADGHPIDLDLAPHLPPVLADARRVRQILQKLIEHALLHGPEGVPIRIAAQRQDRMVEIRVQDRGPGIPPEQLTLMFEHFHRVDGSRAGSLGLAMVKHLVVAHGGRVWAESENGNGATLIFTLPTIA